MDCRLPSCGDGFVQQGVEFCDDGDNNSNAYQSIEEISCNLSCSGWAGYCGDGVIQDAFEMCDEGNQDDDICSSCENCETVRPSAPTILDIRNEGPGIVAVSWDTIEGAESYLIYYEIEGASDPSRVVLDAGVSPLTLTNTEIQLQGLEPGVTLTLAVAALAAGVESCQSSEQTGGFFDGDEPDSAESPIVVTENGMTSRSIEPSSDEDFFEFTIYVSSNVTLETSGTSGDSNFIFTTNREIK